MGKRFFSPEDEKAIIAAIQQAEKNTSGEIRVHVESSKKKHGLDHVKELFFKLKMDKTEQKNGVLFYLNTHWHELIVWGCEGIHEKVQQKFWDDLVEKTTAEFKKGNFTQALVDAILATGEKLKLYYPLKKDDKNELSDEISYS